LSESFTIRPGCTIVEIVFHDPSSPMLIVSDETSRKSCTRSTPERSWHTPSLVSIVMTSVGRVAMAATQGACV
jgi:hypothetical protein